MCQWNNIDKTCLDHAGMLEETHGTQIIIKHKNDTKRRDGYSAVSERVKCILLRSDSNQQSIKLCTGHKVCDYHYR